MADGADVSTPPQRFLSTIFAASGVLGLVSAVSQLVDYFQSGKYTALLWTFAFLVLVVLSAAGIAWRNRVGAFLGRISGSTGPAQWIYPALAIVFVVAAILWSGLVSLGVTDRSWKGRPEASPISVDAVSPQLPPGLPWEDNFDGGALDPSRWRPPPLPDNMSVRDGRLRFEFALGENDDAVSRKELVPIPPGFFIGQVEMTVSAQQTSGPLAGGVILLIRQQSGTLTGIAFGPSKDGPVVEPWICLKEACTGDYNDFVHPADKLVRFDPGQDIPVRAVQTGEHLEVQVGGISFSAKDDPSAILDVRFRVDAAPGDHWAADVDNLKLTPASR